MANKSYIPNYYVIGYIDLLTYRALTGLVPVGTLKKARICRRHVSPLDRKLHTFYGLCPWRKTQNHKFRVTVFENKSHCLKIITFITKSVKYRDRKIALHVNNNVPLLTSYRQNRGAVTLLNVIITGIKLWRTHYIPKRYRNTSNFTKQT